MNREAGVYIGTQGGGAGRENTGEVSGRGKKRGDLSHLAPEVDEGLLMV